jgi:hypothetical protein
MQESLTFTNLSYHKPEYGQFVWLLRKDGRIAPAIFRKSKRFGSEGYPDHFLVIGNTMIEDGAWAEMTIPVNANTSG